ncbi:hypothetical protein [Streptomyces sp. NBRC 110465]|uniref:hypothetical protein n=1 Tax=Streptomyces sp. NBRC 110465 TaxID=1897621 RepID=UPI000B06E34F|nr:hypothetical protein [Streptomyces sp. NBRC 110465]
MNEQPQHPMPPTAHGHWLVVKALQKQPNALRTLHSPGSAEGELADLVVRAALHLDSVQNELVDRCTWAADGLTRVATGTAAANRLGILQTSSTQIDILAARRADAITHLKSALAAYQRATTPQAQRAVSVTPSPSRTSRQTR